jgi:hypothetical protein
MVPTESQDRSCQVSKEGSRRRDCSPSKVETAGGSDCGERREGRVQETWTIARRAGSELIRQASTPRNAQADAYLSLKALAEYSGLSAILFT